MAPPSALAISTSSLRRLIKEEVSYHHELEEQERRLQKLISEISPDENMEWNLKQQRKAIEETRAVFPALRHRIAKALQRLEAQLETDVSCGATNEEIEEAKEIIQNARTNLGQNGSEAIER